MLQTYHMHGGRLLCVICEFGCQCRLAASRLLEPRCAIANADVRVENHVYIIATSIFSIRYVARRFSEENGPDSSKGVNLASNKSVGGSHEGFNLRTIDYDPNGESKKDDCGSGYCQSEENLVEPSEI
jgi:hypothetical protein